MNWIKVRLNKDNFWNIMFWLGMTIGMIITQLFRGNGALTFISFLTTVFGMYFLIKFMQSVRFDRKLGFFNRQGMIQEDSLPDNGGLTACVGVWLLFLFCLFFDKMNVFTSESIIMIWSSFFLIISLYTSYKNCPIAILFTRDIYLHIAQKRIAELLVKVPNLDKSSYDLDRLN